MMVQGLMAEIHTAFVNGKLNKHEFLTLRGQILSGHEEDAKNGFEKMMKRHIERKSKNVRG